jgi:vanillate O-demethylase monooxygenase subunit
MDSSRPAVLSLGNAALRNFWHPVAFEEEVSTQPERVTLLGERLVIFRTEGGTVAALRDLCVHRGTPLSLGWVEGEQIVCPYHGWSYAADGQCRRIPSVSDQRAIPAKARVDSYMATVRYGLVWVCLGDSASPIADYPEFHDPAFHTYYVNSEDWNSSAARLIENFVDAAHFPWVHPGVLGNRARPETPAITVTQADGRIVVALDVAPDWKPDFAPEERWSLWDEITLPFTVRQIRTDERGNRNVIFLAVSPMTATTLKRFIRTSRNFALDQPDGRFEEVSRSVQSQDRRIVEEQRPEELPLDLAEEMHVRGPDDPAVVYRRALATLGIHAP